MKRLNNQNKEDINRMIQKFHKACTAGDIEFIKEALRDKWKEQLIDSTNSELQLTPLCRSILNCQPKIVKLLIINLADSEIRNNDGETAIFQAIHIQSIKIVGMLIRYNAELNVQNNNGDTPLHTSCFNGSEIICRMLLKRGANPNIQNKTKGETPLHVAIDCGYVDIASMILEYGGDLELINFKNQTPLDLATRHDRAMLESKFLTQKRYKSCARNWTKAKPRFQDCNASDISCAKLSLNYSIMQSPANSIIPGYFSNLNINKTFDLRGDSCKRTDDIAINYQSEEKYIQGATSSPSKIEDNKYKRVNRKGYDSIHNGLLANRYKRNASNESNTQMLSTSLNFNAEKLLSKDLIQVKENKNAIVIKNLNKNRDENYDSQKTNSSNKLNIFNSLSSKLKALSGKTNLQSEKQKNTKKIKFGQKGTFKLNRYSKLQGKEDSFEKYTKIHNKENINYETHCAKPKGCTSKVQQRYSKYEEPEHVTNVSKISNKLEDRISHTSECDCSDLMNELITWREMDERVANTLDYSSSKENNDIDEAINDPHQIMICNGKEEIIYVNSENDFICSNTQKDTLTSNDFIESDYVKNMRTSLLFSEPKIKSEDSQRHNIDFIYNTCQNMNSSPIDVGMNIENTIVRHKIPHNSLTRHKFHKSISISKAREFFVKFGKSNQANNQKFNNLNTRNNFSIKTINRTTVLANLSNSFEDESNASTSKQLLNIHKESQKDNDEVDKPNKNWTSDIANALGDNLQNSLSCTSNNYSEEGEVDIESAKLSDGPPTKRTMISEMARANYVSVGKYKDLNAIMKEVKNPLVKINSEYDLFDSACLSESPEPTINQFYNMRVSINNLGARKDYSYSSSFGPTDNSFAI